MTFTPFEAAAVLVVIAAILGYMNYIWFRMPHTIGLTVMGAVASILMIALDAAVPGLAVGEAVRSFLKGIEFDEVLLEAMLSFLLFAGALHINLDV
ncbi:MAG: sodium:proton antiporter, partial [Pseudomonadota bacterium]